MPTDPTLAPLLGPRPLLEVRQVAHRIGFGEEYVLKLIRAKRLTAIPFGRRWRVDPRDLDAYIDACRAASLEARSARPRNGTHPTA